MDRPRGATSSPRSASCRPAAPRAPALACSRRAPRPRARRARRAPRRAGAAGKPMSKRRASCEARSRASRVLERRVARPRRRQLRDAVAAHVEVAGAVRPAQPLLARGGVEVAAERVHVDRHGAEGLGAVEQHGRAGARQAPCRSRAAVTHDTCEQATSRVPGRPRRPARRTERPGRDPRRSRAAASGASRPGCSSSLVSTSSPGAEVERGQHGVHAVGGGAGERQLGRAQPSRPATRSRRRRPRQQAGRRIGPPRAPRRVWRRSDARAASSARRGHGPFVPAFR